jgi:hypothetical protein
MNKINFTGADFSSLSNLVVVASDDQISRDLDGEAVILNMKSGVYCGLNEVGAHIWQLIQEPMSVGHIRDILLEVVVGNMQDLSRFKPLPGLETKTGNAQFR